jgi:hypothetical protein
VRTSARPSLSAASVSATLNLNPTHPAARPVRGKQGTQDPHPGSQRPCSGIIRDAPIDSLQWVSAPAPRTELAAPTNQLQTANNLTSPRIWASISEALLVLQDTLRVLAIHSAGTFFCDRRSEPALSDVICSPTLRKPNLVQVEISHAAKTTCTVHLLPFTSQPPTITGRKKARGIRAHPTALTSQESGRTNPSNRPPGCHAATGSSGYHPSQNLP